MKNIKNIFLIVIMIFCLILVGCGNKEKNVSKNILDTSTEEYQKVIIAIVSLAYAEDEMFQFKNLYTTNFPYMRFKILCKHETEESFKKETRKVAETVFYTLKNFEYKSPFWRYTHELVNLEFESEKRHEHTGILEYSNLYTIDVTRLKNYETFEDYFYYRTDI